MRKLLLIALLLCMGAVICGGPVATLAADKPVEISTCWMDESPGFNIWYAKKMGWDKEEGLDIEVVPVTNVKEAIAYLEKTKEK